VLLDIGPLKLVALVVVAVLVFGPDKLPKLIADAMRFVRALRAISDSATQDIRQELGPEFADFEVADLNPRTFVRKQLAAHSESLGPVQELAQDLRTESGALRERTVAAEPDRAGAGS
jgi:sec-independent protein translocase protein TatB